MERTDPDGDLVRRIAIGDQAAMRALVACKLPRMIALAQRLLGDRAEAEDIVQELFLRVWRHAAAWRPGAARFDTWMHQVALNLCRDRLRRRRDVPLPDDWDAPDPAPLADAGLDAAARGDRVAAALARLSSRQREAIVLSYYQELPNREAAASMELSIDALESLLARARRTLKALLEERDVG